MKSKSGDLIQCPTSSYRVCYPRSVMACHARRHLTMCDVLGRRWHATPDVVRPCVLPKGGDGMPRPTSSDRVCCPRAMMTCHARRRSTVSASPKAMMECHARRHLAIHARRCSTVCAAKGDDGMARPTSSDRVCCPKAMMACHAGRRPTVCAAQRR